MCGDQVPHPPYNAVILNRKTSKHAQMLFVNEERSQVIHANAYFTEETCRFAEKACNTDFQAPNISAFSFSGNIFMLTLQ